MTYSAIEVANWFIEKSLDENSSNLTHLKVQKLVFIAHGWYLAITGEPLIEEDIEAWPLGPVIPDLYHELKRYGQNIVKEPIIKIDAPHYESIEEYYFNEWDFVSYIPKLPKDYPELQNVLTKIWEIYKDKSGYYLSYITHKPDTPWSKTIKNYKENTDSSKIIRNEIIETYYKDLLAKYFNISNS